MQRRFAAGSPRRCVWKPTRAALALCTATLLAGCEPAVPEDRSAEVEAASSRAVREPEPEVPAHVLDARPAGRRTVGIDSVALQQAYASAAELPRLHCLLVARGGEVYGERCFRGPGLDGVTNVKSASKSVLSALVGIAIAEGHLEGVDQRIAPFFSEYLPAESDSLRQRITVGNLLSMQSGLERTSGGNYGRWVLSPNWVRYAITRPMETAPGGRMLYSTGNTHLLSAILTEATGQSTWAYARERLAEPLGIRLPRWPTDPQGIFFGGNDMLLTPRGMLRFGEMYRNHGRHQGRQVVPEAWVRESLVPRTRSPWSGEQYGYGWFVGESAGHPMFYAWGYGGQYIFVVPGLDLTVVTTSTANASRNGGHLDAIQELLDRWIVPGAVRGGVGGAPQAL